MSVRKVIGTNPRRMKKDSEQDEIRIIAVDTSADLARRLTALLVKDKMGVRLGPGIDRVLERSEPEPSRSSLLVQVTNKLDIVKLCLFLLIGLAHQRYLVASTDLDVFKHAPAPAVRILIQPEGRPLSCCYQK